MSTGTGPSPAHDADPLELLSAYLDSELDDPERAVVDQALAGSPELRNELDELRATQAMLRTLPLVEPVAAQRGPIEDGRSAPRGAARAAACDEPVDVVVVSLDARRRRRSALLASIGVIAAAVVVVVGVGATLDPMPVAPAVDELASAHTGTAGGFSDMDADTMDDVAVLETLGDGLDRRAVYARDDLVRTVYSDGRREVSVFHQPGVVDWDALPADGVMAVDGATKTWTGVRYEALVAVGERGDLMVIVVTDAEIGTDEAVAKAMDAIDTVPSVRIERSLWDRVSDAPANLIDRL